MCWYNLEECLTVPSKSRLYVHVHRGVGLLYALQMLCCSSGEGGQAYPYHPQKTSLILWFCSWCRYSEYQAYLGFLDTDVPGFTNASYAYYGPALDTLLCVKAKYDPGNMFYTPLGYGSMFGKVGACGGAAMHNAGWTFMQRPCPATCILHVNILCL